MNSDQLQRSDETKKRLIDIFHNTPRPSVKLSNYFEIYTDLFGHLVNTKCTLIEIGVLAGGSLFMWREWLGKDARIIGIDLNPDALKWQDFGFEIYIGDQGDPCFLEQTLNQIGHFDVLLDDGGHQSFQQINTVVEALKSAKGDCLVVIEDTCTSFMKSFSMQGQRTFLEYAKAATDNLTARDCNFFPGEFSVFENAESLKLFRRVYNIQFFANLIAFKVKATEPESAQIIWNLEAQDPPVDYRLNGKNEAIVNWPDPRREETIVVKGHQA
jgi:hypothetical protein